MDSYNEWLRLTDIKLICDSETNELIDIITNIRFQVTNHNKNINNSNLTHSKSNSDKVNNKWSGHSSHNNRAPCRPIATWSSKCSVLGRNSIPVPQSLGSSRADLYRRNFLRFFAPNSQFTRRRFWKSMQRTKLNKKITTASFSSHSNRQPLLRIYPLNSILWKVATWFSGA